MNFASLGSGNKRARGTSGRFDLIKNFFYPSGRQERSKRMKQYKDISLFVGSILLVTVFEKQIQKLLQVDKSELTQFTNMQQ
jgi:hypothetical protein